VDTQGLLLVVQVTAAHVQDQHQLPKLLEAGRQVSQRLEVVCVDEGYQNNLMHLLVAYQLGILLEMVSRPSEQRGFVPLPRRWVVERTFAWLGRYRRLSKDYEFEPQSSESMIYLAMSKLMLRRLAKKRQGKVA
jgi:putative transposase